ncbi:MAG TPA: DUF6491 family protein [Vitreimonas sp.]|jgi:hypothetical protein|nr:DUF6491 family protein [Vitreimonas sp.]
MRTLFIASLVALAACSTTTAPRADAANAPGDRDCFLASSVNGYNVVDDHTVRVTVGASRHYLLGTTWNAHDLNWSEAIALRSPPSGWVCTGNGLGVEVRGGHPPQTYPITSVTREPDAAPAQPAPSGS